MVIVFGQMNEPPGACLRVGLTGVTMTEYFRDEPGKYVKLLDTVKSFRRIIDGEFDDLPEQAFCMRGGIEEVIEAAEANPPR